MIATGDILRLALDADEAAAALGVCRKTLYNHTAPRGKLRSFQVGSARRYAVAELNRWIVEQEQIDSMSECDYDGPNGDPEIQRATTASN